MSTVRETEIKEMEDKNKRENAAVGRKPQAKQEKWRGERKAMTQFWRWKTSSILMPYPIFIFTNTWTLALNNVYIADQRIVGAATFLYTKL